MSAKTGFRHRRSSIVCWPFGPVLSMGVRSTARVNATEQASMHPLTLMPSALKHLDRAYDCPPDQGDAGINFTRELKNMLTGQVAREFLQCHSCIIEWGNAR